MNRKFTVFVVSMLLSLLILPLSANAQTAGKALLKRMPQTNRTRVSMIPSEGSLTTTFKMFGYQAPKNAASPLFQAADGTTLYGDIIYSDTWKGTSHYGVSSFNVTNPISLTSQIEDANFKSNAGAVYYNGQYTIVNATEGSDGSISSINTYVYDAETWEETNEDELSDAKFIATDLTVDPLTNKIYGAFSDGNGGMQLATMNYDTKEYVVKGALSIHIMALAIDAEGNLFGFGSDSKLYAINKDNAALTAIGATGIKASTYLQSATFDWKSGKLYWATTLSTDIAGLYEVDTTTGKATLVAQFPNNEEVIGLFCKNKVSQDGAPAAVTDLTKHFDKASTTGTLSFSLPTLTNAGGTLSGTLNYSVTVNGEEKATGTGAPGAAITTSELTLNAGSAKIIVTASNATGKGTPALMTTWIGNDAPAAVSNLKAGYADKKVTLTWDAPTAGLNDGYVDLTQVKYDVTRYPDNVKVATGITATSFTETFSPETLAPYYYEVTASAGSLTGGTAKSNVFAAGNAIVPPYIQNFNDDASLSLMTVIDANEDGTKWTLDGKNGYAEIRYADESGDDWLITPLLKLAADRLYKLSFKAVAPWGPNWNERFSVSYGKSATADAMTEELVPTTVLSTTDTCYVNKYFKVAEAGDINIGIHATSYELYQLQLFNLAVVDGPYLEAPDSATAIKATPATEGKLSVDLAFTTPSKTISGTALTALTKVEVYRNDQLIKTIDNPAVGTALTYTDAAAINGFNTYKILAYNAKGEGMPASIKVFAGIDVPSAPTDVVLKDAGDSKIQLTWKAPVIGANGGYVNASTLVYGIKSSDNVVKETTYKSTTYSETIDQTGDQKYLMYGVFAGNTKGYGAAGISNAIVVGNPYTLPYSEDFKDGKTHSFWGANTPETSYASWGAQTGESADGDNGCLHYSGGQPGNESTIFSGKLNVGNAANPVLEFYYWYRAEDGNKPLDVQVISEGKDTTVVKSLSYTKYMYAKDFELVRVPLSQFKSAKYIQIAFHCISGDDVTAAAIDGVQVRDYKDNDLTASLTAPASASAGDTISVSTKVRNIGAKNADKYTVDLYQGSRLLTSQNGTGLKSDSTGVFNFRVPVGTLADTLRYSAVITLETADGNQTFKTNEDTVAVTLPETPTPTGLSGTANDGTANLTWTAPDYEHYAVPTIDGAESYPEFTVNSIGDWTVRDKDGLKTRSDISVDGYPVAFTHEGEAMGFIVMNPVDAKAQLTNWMGDPTGWQTVSGKQYFASFGSADGANDDWLISPELTGEAQHISFNIHGYYGDAFEVLVSSTDTATTSFVKIDSCAAAQTWTLKGYDLPAGTKYFAIRNISSDNPNYIFIDDIKFATTAGVGALKLSGYNIYRDGVKLNDKPVSATAYTDKQLPVGTYLYQVTAVYNLGESASASFELAITTGIADVTKDGTTVVARYDISGKKLNAATKGINIIKMSDGTYRKVIRK